MTASKGESAKMGGSGWYLESRRAVLPVSVKMAMAATSRSSAAWDMHSQMVSAMERRTLAGWPRARTGLDADLVLGFGDDLGHHGDGFDGIFAGGGLAGEHDGVGAVVDGVGDVGGFGAGGARVFDHRLEHLRGGDDGLAVLGGAANDVLLDGGNFFGRDFDAEIATGDHDGVGDFEDAVEVLDGLGLFELGDDPGIGVEGGEAVLDVADVVGGADEGDGDGVDALADGEDEVFLVLFGERGNFDGDAGEIDALVFAEHAAVDDLADDIDAFDLLDAQFDEAVGEQDAGAGLEVFGEGLEGGADESGGAFDLARGDGEALASDELDGLVALELAGADLGTLQVGEDADGLALLFGDLVRTMRMSSAFWAWVPWEKLRRATSRPARTSWRKTSRVLQEGPRVATILARRPRSIAARGTLFGLGFREVFMDALCRDLSHHRRNMRWYDQ